MPDGYVLCELNFFNGFEFVGGVKHIYRLVYNKNLGMAFMALGV